ncbi:MAG TPA: PKD domain-containing protein, partial [Methanomicrobiales archaeon]|nr:PKD domain-containing protein [Methanomicrobiales archaeon]
MTRGSRRSSATGRFGRLSYLEMVIAGTIVLGIVFTAGLLALESREERFTSFFLVPGSYANYPSDNTTSFTYGIRSFEKERTSYDLKISIGNRLADERARTLDPGEAVEENETLDLGAVALPAKVSLLLTSPFASYEVHYWLKESPPVAAFSAAPISGKEPLNVTFTDLSTNNPGSWSWKFGDGSTSNEEDPVHTFSAGTFTVSLVAGNSGGSDERVMDDLVVVLPLQLPLASFTANVTHGKEPLVVGFTDTSKNDPTSWKWEFGDDSISTVQNPVHSYSPGNYTVNLTVANPDGSDMISRENLITVGERNPPVAAF